MNQYQSISIKEQSTGIHSDVPEFSLWVAVFLWCYALVGDQWAHQAWLARACSRLVVPLARQVLHLLPVNLPRLGLAQTLPLPPGVCSLACQQPQACNKLQLQ